MPPPDLLADGGTAVAAEVAALVLSAAPLSGPVLVEDVVLPPPPDLADEADMGGTVALLFEAGDEPDDEADCIAAVVAGWGVAVLATSSGLPEGAAEAGFTSAFGSAVLAEFVPGPEAGEDAEADAVSTFTSVAFKSMVGTGRLGNPASAGGREAVDLSSLF